MSRGSGRSFDRAGHSSERDEVRRLAAALIYWREGRGSLVITWIRPAQERTLTGVRLEKFRYII